MKPEHCYICHLNYYGDDRAWIAAPIGNMVVFLCSECSSVFYPVGSYPNDLLIPEWVKKLVKRVEQNRKS